MEKNKENGKISVKLIVIILVFVLLAAAGLFVLKYGKNYIYKEITDRTNLVLNYTNVTGKVKNDMYINEDDVIYLSMEDIANYYDKHIYYDKQYNQIVTSSEEKVATLKIDEKSMIVNGQNIKIKDGAIYKNGIYYLPISEMEQVYNIKIERLNNRIVIESLDRELTTAKVDKKANLKNKTTVFSKTIEKLEKDEKVAIAESKNENLPGGWVKVRTQSGKIGYIEEKYLSNKKIEREAKTYPSQVSGHISLVWEYFSKFYTAPDNTGKEYSGVNVVSPSFFNLRLEDTGKENLTKDDVKSLSNIYDNVGEAGKNYIDWAHKNEYKVWAMVANETLATTIDEFSAMINDYELRQNMINQIVNYAESYNLDGINLDFEYMYADDKDAYSKFIIELAPRLREKGIVLSVDVTAPDGDANWSGCFNRNLIGEVADYIVFMAYDQNTGKQIGTTAGYNWVKTNINKFLGQEEVPAEKIILGLPFYTRLIKTQNDTYINSDAISIADVNSVIPANVEKQWLEDMQQYYIQYNKGLYVYKMWIEDHESFEKKLSLVKENNLAGAAYWKMSFADDKVWEIIEDNLNLKK